MGLGLGDPVPDGTTLANFRKRMQSVGLQAKLLAELEATLQAEGLLAKKGTLVDATFIQSARRKSDPDQAVGHKGKGYSASVAVDASTKLVRRVATTDASVHDSKTLAAVLPGDPGKVYADLGYWGEPCRAAIRQVGGIPCIPHKRTRGKNLIPWQAGVNAVLAKTRSRVEHVFARWKTGFKLRNSRYAGLGKVNAYLHGIALAYNFQRLGFLFRRRALAWG